MILKFLKKMTLKKIFFYYLFILYIAYYIIYIIVYFNVTMYQ